MRAVLRLPVIVALLTLPVAANGCGSSSDEQPAPVLSVSGRVVLKGLATHAGVSVMLAGAVSASTTTGDGGAFSFSVPTPGLYTLIAHANATAERSLVRTVSVGAAATPTSEIEFTPLGDVSGVVITPPSIERSGITVIAAGDPAVALTDTAGRYTLRGVAAGHHDIIATAGGLGTGIAKNIAVPYASTIAAPDILLEPRARGTAAVTGKALLAGETSHGGIVVTLAGPTTLAMTTDATGAIAFNDLPDGEYQLSAAAKSTLEGVVSQTVKVTGMGTTVGDITFTPFGRIRGTVSVGGGTTDPSGILVYTTGSAATLTDGMGGYVLDRVPTIGERTVRAAKSGYATGSAAVAKVMYAAEVVAPNIDLKHDPSTIGSITGLATLPAATNHSGTRATLSSAGLSATTDAAGRYSIPGLTGGSSFALTLMGADPAYREDVGQVLVVPGTDGFYVSPTGLIALPALELARGKRVTRDHVSGNFSASDGSRFAWLDRLSTSEVGLNVYDASTKTISTAARDVGFGSLQFSSNLRFAWYFVSATTEYKLVNLVTGTTTVLSSGGSYIYNLAFTQDSSRLYWTNSLGELRYLETSAPTAAQLVGRFSSIDSLSVSPDGKNAFYVGYSMPTLVTMSPGATPRVLAAPSGGSSGAKWSPDSAFVVFSASGTIGVADAATATATMHAKMTWGEEQFSPDGRKIIARRYDPASTVVIELSTGTVTALPTTSSMARWMPDSASVVYECTSCFGSGRALGRIGIASGSTPALVARVNNLQRLFVTKDAKYVVFDEHDGVTGYRTVAVSLDSGTSVAIGATAGHASSTLDPTAKRVVRYAAADSWALGTLTVTTLGGATVTLSTKAPSALVAFSPDGSHIAFLERASPTETFMMMNAGGTMSVPLVRQGPSSGFTVGFTSGNEAFFARGETPGAPFQRGLLLSPP